MYFYLQNMTEYILHKFYFYLYNISVTCSFNFYILFVV